MKVAIIGSGLSGLTAGLTLAKVGHEVSVFEQYHRAGGVTAPYERQGFKWDLGQLIVEGFGSDEPVGIILAELGVLDKIRVRVEDRGYVFPDFALKKPEEYAGIKWRINLLKQLFPDEADGLEHYWKDYLRFTSVMTFARRLEKASALAALYLKIRMYLRLLPLLPKKDWSAQRLMAHYFKSEKLRIVFISILADFFTPDSQFIGLGVFALNPEASFDKRMPRLLAKDTEQLYHYSILGGISTLVDALVRQIEAHGGKVYTNRLIEKIQVEADHVTGVVDGNGEFTPADVVVASGGAKETFFKLVGEEHLPADFAANLRTLHLMDSVFMLHLGVDFDPSPYLHGPITYFYGSTDLEGAIVEAKSGVFHEGKEGFVVHVPSLHSPEMAPPGQHAMTIYTICPDRLAEGDWSSRKEEFTDKFLSYTEARIPGLRQHIRTIDILTPDDFRLRTYLDHHAFGGIMPVMGMWRVPFKSPVQGLWFVGAQSESGGGVNNVIPGAYKTAQRILKEV